MCLFGFPRRRAALRHEDPLRQTGQAARLPGAPLQPGALIGNGPFVRPDVFAAALFLQTAADKFWGSRVHRRAKPT